MKLLVVFDFSEPVEKFANRIEELAKALSAKLWLLHVADPEPDFIGFKIGPKYIRDSRSNTFHSEHRLIQEIAARFRNAGLDTTALLVQGATVETILNEASKLNVDMIVLGSHEHGAMHRLIAGSVSEAVLHKSERPLFIFPIHEQRTSPASDQVQPEQIT